MEQEIEYKSDDQKEEKQHASTTNGAASRSLKIEEDRDRFYGRVKPKIRLQGNWLNRAGFKPGTRVSVTCIAPGIIELRSNGKIPDATEAP